jgi:hypothetical protein
VPVIVAEKHSTTIATRASAERYRKKKKEREREKGIRFPKPTIAHSKIND